MYTYHGIVACNTRTWDICETNFRTYITGNEVIKTVIMGTGILLTSWLLLALCISNISMATNPGFILSLSQKGLNYAADVAIDQLSGDVQGQTIPDQQGEDKNHLGKVTYYITGTKVTSFTKPSSALTVTPDHGISWSLSGAGAAVHGDWRYKYKKAFVKASDHGSFDVTVSGVSLQVAIAMGVDQNGRPTISMTSCSCDVKDVSVKFHGGASFLYNLFKKTLERPIEKKLKELMCESVKKAVNVDAAKSLSEMKVEVPLEGILTLDYRLVAPPVFGTGFVESLHKGEFLWTENPTDPPFAANPITVPRGAQKMVTFCLSDYVMNSLGYIIHSQGFLKYTLTKSDLPEKYCDYLNTRCASGTCVGSFLPNLGKDFPEGSVELSMKTTSAPTITTSDDVITGDFYGEVVFNVRLPDRSLKHAFTTTLDAKMPLKVEMSRDRVTLSVESFRFNVTKTVSDIGNIPDPVLDFLFNLASQQFIIPKLNEKGQKGLRVPSIDHVEFIDPELVMTKGAVCFSTDAKYDPTLRFQPHESQ